LRDELVQYGRFLDDIRTRIRQAQTRAVMSANAEMIIFQRYVRIRNLPFIVTESSRDSCCGIGIGEE